MPEQFEPSPVMPKGMDDEDDTMFGLPGTGDGTGSMTTGEKEILKETSNVAKIKVVVCYYVLVNHFTLPKQDTIQLTRTSKKLKYNYRGAKNFKKGDRYGHDQY